MHIWEVTVNWFEMLLNKYADRNFRIYNSMYISTFFYKLNNWKEENWSIVYSQTLAQGEISYYN